MNPFEIDKPCIIISKRELLFEQYRMALNWDKYDIEVQNDDAIKRNWIFSDFMHWTFNRMDGLYLHERCLLIYKILEFQSTEQKKKGQKQK